MSVTGAGAWLRMECGLTVWWGSGLPWLGTDQSGVNEYGLAGDPQRKTYGWSDGVHEVDYNVATKLRELDFSGGSGL